jgi:hypothetical protein
LHFNHTKQALIDMTEKYRGQLSRLKIAIGIFIFVLAAAICYLFYPTVRCVFEWGEYSNACQEEFMLTLLMPFAAFFVVWGILLTMAVLIFRNKD